MLLPEGKFTTDACQFDQRECHCVSSWKPILPGQYNILVHKIDWGFDKSLLIQPPHTFLVTKLNAGVGLSMLKDRVLNMLLCQTRTKTNVYSHWEGDWLGPKFQ
jgi:hypothetical protein